MGNRAVITTSKSRDSGCGIYIHWNGGLASVLAFLAVAKARDYRSPGSDPSYSMGRLCGLIHEFFGPLDALSLGIGPLSGLDCDNGDNGVYVIGGDWEIVDRWGQGATMARTLGELDEGGLQTFSRVQSILSEVAE